jgi:hypothetical protein
VSGDLSVALGSPLSEPDGSDELRMVGRLDFTEVLVALDRIAVDESCVVVLS